MRNALHSNARPGDTAAANLRLAAPAQPGGLRLARLWHARGSHRYPSTPSTPVTLPTLSNDFNFICCIKERCHCNPFAPGSLPDRSLRTPRIALTANKSSVNLGYLLTHLSLSDGPMHEMPTSTCVASVSSTVSCLHPLLHATYSVRNCYLSRHDRSISSIAAAVERRHPHQTRSTRFDSWSPFFIIFSQ